MHYLLKIKKRKFCVWAENFFNQGKTFLFIYENNMSLVNYIEILKEALKEIKFKLSCDDLMLEMDNERYYLTTKV